jgi:hypothetical protein
MPLKGEIMTESIFDAMRLAAAGAAGGLIYWAARHHGEIFAVMWRKLARR